MSCFNAQQNEEQQHNAAAIYTWQMKPASQYVLSKQATIKLTANQPTQLIKAEGYIEQDKTQTKTISARVGGRIEKLYVLYPLQHLKKGEKIMEIYSPEINTLQEEHLFLLQAKADKNLIEKSRERLLLLGVTNTQLKQLETTNKTNPTLTVYSKEEGYVLFDEMLSENALKQGMYVIKEQPLFKLNNFKNVWAVISIPFAYVGEIKENLKVTISTTSLPTKKISSVISQIEQTFEDEKQRFIKARIVLPNSSNNLKINELITAEIQLEANVSFSVPSSAVYRTGLGAIVWVKTSTTEAGTTVFKRKKVTIGATLNGKTIIINGLLPNEEIAKNASYLTDSETLLN